MKRGRKPHALPETIEECHAIIVHLRAQTNARANAYRQRRLDGQQRKDQRAMLHAIAKWPGYSIAGLAETAPALTADGKPSKSKAQRIINTLRLEGLVFLTSAGWELSHSGRKSIASETQNPIIIT